MEEEEEEENEWPRIVVSLLYHQYTRMKRKRKRNSKVVATGGANEADGENERDELYLAHQATNIVVLGRDGVILSLHLSCGFAT